MTEKAKKVWDVAEKHGLAPLLEANIADLEAFSEGLQSDSELDILEYLYRSIVFETA